jgi:hypothetical protein
LLVLLVAVLAAIVPAAAGHAHHIVLTAGGIVVPTIHVTVLGRTVTQSDERPAALLSLDFFRAPPVLPVIA